MKVVPFWVHAICIFIWCKMNIIMVYIEYYYGVK